MLQRILMVTFLVAMIAAPSIAFAGGRGAGGAGAGGAAGGAGGAAGGRGARGAGGAGGAAGGAGAFGGAAGAPGGRGGAGAAQTMDAIKVQLGASDAEWQVIMPKLQKVIDTRAIATIQTPGIGGGAGGRGGAGRGGAGGPAAAIPANNPVAAAQNDLRTSLENPGAPADEIAAKLKILRSARDQARKDVEAAQKDLKDVLTARQEAVLVNLGYLE